MSGSSTDHGGGKRRSGIQPRHFGKEVHIKWVTFPSRASTPLQPFVRDFVCDNSVVALFYVVHAICLPPIALQPIPLAHAGARLTGTRFLV
jgi:hypothetical protein